MVQAIVREFERYPPSISENQQSINVPTQDQTISQSQPHQQPTPTLNGSDILDFSSLSTDQLELLNSDSQYLDDFIENMTVVQKPNEELDQLLTEVEEIASKRLAKHSINFYFLTKFLFFNNLLDDNVSCEEQLLETKKRLQETISRFQSLGSKYDQLSSIYKQKSEVFTPQHIQQLLQIAVSTSDSLCEKHVDDFLNGRMEVQAFLTEYMEAKKLSALRKAKEDRLALQLRQLERATY